MVFLDVLQEVRLLTVRVIALVPTLWAGWGQEERKQQDETHCQQKGCKEA